MSDSTNLAALQQRVEALEAELEQSRKADAASESRQLANQNLIELLPHEVHVWELIRNSDDSIRTWKLDYANPAALTSWDKQLDEVKGLTPEEIFDNPDTTDLFMPTVEQIFETGQPHMWEQHFESTNQTLQMVSIPFGECFISTGLDISEQKQLQQELRQLQKMEAIGQLAGGIAHDFNNQLLGIIGCADMLEDDLADSPSLNEVHIIQNCAQRAADLTSQLLAFARKGTLELKTMCVNEQINELISLLSHTAPKQVELQTSLESDHSLRVRGDPSLIQNAILNVALNACDAMPDGGRLSIETKLLPRSEAKKLGNGKLDPEDDFVSIVIQDTGSGMDSSTVEQIFHPYFTTKPKGSGMGLATVYGSIKRHDGHVLVDSNVDEGTRFEILLPLWSGPEEEEEEVWSAQSSENENHEFNLLVVDDEPMLRAMCARMLTRAGHHVMTAQDGQEAVGLYKKEHATIDAVLLDMNMPRMNGLNAFLEMQKINPDVIALISSGYNLKETSDEFLSLGIKGFVDKPYRNRALLKALNEAVDQ